MAPVSDADAFNSLAILLGTITDRHVSEMTRIAQRAFGLVVDGKCGPATRAALEAQSTPLPTGPRVTTSLDDLVMTAPPAPAVISVEGGWLVGTRVRHVKSKLDWQGRLSHPKPLAIVAHYTDTDPGTGLRMAETRRDRDRASFPEGKRPGSWHVTIETDGSVIQQVSLLRAAWHAGSPTAVPIPGLGPANRCSVGIELVGHGAHFPDAQVQAACRVWRAIVREYAIARENAMVRHSDLDPRRRKDPGLVWLRDHAGRVLDEAYR